MPCQSKLVLVGSSQITLAAMTNFMSRWSFKPCSRLPMNLSFCLLSLCPLLSLLSFLLSLWILHMLCPCLCLFSCLSLCPLFCLCLPSLCLLGFFPRPSVVLSNVNACLPCFNRLFLLINMKDSASKVVLCLVLSCPVLSCLVLSWRGVAWRGVAWRGFTCPVLPCLVLALALSYLLFFVARSIKIKI